VAYTKAGTREAKATR